MANTFYVKASADPSNLYALCTYYTDPECQHQVDSPLRIPQQAGGVTFQLVANGNNWQMVGAVADRVDTPEIDPTMVLAANNAVTIAMPTSTKITEGVVLVFTSTNVPTQLYASSDPQVENTD
ncbi:MAG: hypothetical protein ACK4S6_11400 [Roseateles asaccharophilus]|jgi:hypothetical protein|uniref:Uncharacterized protein n=1 Tax=Roseateles asaccharophilus TaxID=582607 RepID=A0A4R6NAD2_9BURK|nr:hypothetical protein [Roseateles asaccharophilus]MDN3544938.1 hypothetical protein [Roseateles asaccharophilus]TDP12676.1 hypothetical protein DFR39_101149 [Roseateles asaccharophilus]